MLRKFNLLILSVLLTSVYAYSQSGLGTLKGSVKDEKSKAGIFGCKVLLKQNGSIKGGQIQILTVNFKLTHLLQESMMLKLEMKEKGIKQV
jgi:hypothetical protein